MSPLELWAGAECTVNRVGDRWFDQLRRTGHHDRIDDLDLLAGLGVRRVRFPVLWERVAARGLANADWDWCDRGLARLQQLGIDPIVGLVHHGSGPAGTQLVDAGFVEGLAELALAVARRYPWVRQWTPVNEPLTTARFSGLYGHWYPHARELPSFLRALLVEVQATAAAMRRIREVVPSAELVQTEDLGRVTGTDALRQQLEYEGHRRWLSLDLLAGRVDARHPLRRDCEAHGLGEAELDALVDAPCPPDIVGINYYLTSDRFLDHRIEGYPAHLVGGNGRQRYADVEAVRVADGGIAGHRAVLDEVWDRYRLPVALTEVHLGCTREDQLRWLAEAWDAATEARAAGVDVRGVTLWSAFGAVDWHCLVTRDEGRYEPGVFDIRAPVPRPTAIAELARQLATGGPRHPLLDGSGWWRRASCHVYGTNPLRCESPPQHQRPLLVVGTGMLARRLVERCHARGIAVEAASSVDARRFDASPWAVVAVGELALRGGRPGDGARLLTLARGCARRGLTLATFSTPDVFGRDGARAHRESDPCRPATVHGRERAELERAFSSAAPHALLVRTGLLLDPDDPDDALVRVIAALRSGARVVLPDDELVAVSCVTHLLDATLDLLIDGRAGVWHGASAGVTSLLQLARASAERSGLEGFALASGRAATPWGLEVEPGMHALASELAWPMPPLVEALDHYAATSARARRDPTAA